MLRGGNPTAVTMSETGSVIPRSPHRRRLLRRMARLGFVAVLVAALSPAIASASDTGWQGSDAEIAATYVFAGGGWGHGLGMSQYGACGMAAGGSTHGQILAHFYQGTQLQDLSQPGGIRVRVEDATGRALVTPQEVPLAFRHNGRTLLTVAVGESASVVPVGDGFAVEGRTGPLGPGVLDMPLPGGRRPVRVSPPNVRYDRGIVVFRNIGGQLQVTVEGLGMQDYLYGLAEVPSSWPAAALRAQAIAGRTYAKSAIDRRRAADPSRTWDLDGSVLDQVYAGFDKEESAGPWLDAVNATPNDTVTAGGTAIQAFYSSSSGGHTENNEVVWAGTPLSYLRGVPDPGDGGCGNPNHSWQRSYSSAELTRWLARYPDTAVGTIQDVRVSGPRGASGRVDRATFTLIGSTATKQVTGSRFRLVVNAGVTSEGGGLNRQILSTLFAYRGSNPIGHVDSITLSPAGVRVAGWVFDPNSSAPLTVHVYAAGAYVGGGPANLSRPDVQAAFGLETPNHGFNLTVVPPAGTSQLCVYGLNIGPGSTTRLGCSTITWGLPFGHFDVVTRTANGVRAIGWTIDSNVVTPLTVHIYANGRYVGGGVASSPRPDVAARYPGYGEDHGFDLVVPTTPGPQQVCVYGINVGPGWNTRIGCRVV